MNKCAIRFERCCVLDAEASVVGCIGARLQSNVF